MPAEQFAFAHVQKPFCLFLRAKSSTTGSSAAIYLFVWFSIFRQQRPKKRETKRDLKGLNLDLVTTALFHFAWINGRTISHFTSVRFISDVCACAIWCIRNKLTRVSLKLMIKFRFMMFCAVVTGFRCFVRQLFLLRSLLVIMHGLSLGVSTFPLPSSLEKIFNGNYAVSNACQLATFSSFILRWYAPAPAHRRFFIEIHFFKW